MPELPEVETVVRDLRPLVVGRTVRAVRNGKRKLRKPWKPAWNEAVAGCRIEAIRRRGKWIIIDLTPRPPSDLTPPPPSRFGKGEPIKAPSPLRGGGGGERSLSPPRLGEGSKLLVHLGMTGQFTAVGAAEPQPDHLHLVFELDEGTELRFRDQRRFGSVTYYPDEAAVLRYFAETGLGPEPFGLDPAHMYHAVRTTARTLKAILLDQRVVAGVGNIYADEACFLARLHPRRRGKTLTYAEVDRLREAVEAVLTRAIDRRGSTIRDYVGGSGLRGGFQNEFAVYGRTGEPCGVCETAIACVRLSGRASHFCPGCQRSAIGRQPGKKQASSRREAG
jgi:formamidopyrimidine-DNA glycosylase